MAPALFRSGWLVNIRGLFPLRRSRRREVARRSGGAEGGRGVRGLGSAARAPEGLARRTLHGGGGNRTRVRGRTGLNVYKRSPRFDLTRRPGTDALPPGQPSFGSRASGDWLSLRAEPV